MAIAKRFDTLVRGRIIAEKLSTPVHLEQPTLAPIAIQSVVQQSILETLSHTHANLARGKHSTARLTIRPVHATLISAIGSTRWSRDVSVLTTPFTGPRRTTFHFKTARPAAPCATACSHSCLALGRHHPGGGNVRLSGQLGKSGLPGKFFARDRANCCPSRVNRQDVNVGCAGVFRLPPPSNRCGWLCSNSISVWYRLAIIPLSSPSS